ncbi:hypothetical protein MAR_006534 [Mya arenaria]|uniref:Endonuclease/exonuclease/phosphatase domain-containing protein n=1 Tax=Mya arenaria TaxID=6604 RepID=A0ABY7DDA1_MYAAR|nr:hypothetical protein MAR_006534 [Mya arenaria]
MITHKSDIEVCSVQIYGRNTLIVGDFNLKHICWNPAGDFRYDGEADDLLTFLNDNNLNFLNDGQITRVSEKQNESDSAIDLSLISSHLHSSSEFYKCSKKCQDYSILCETCSSWSHFKCQQIDRNERDQWRKSIKLPYICIVCRSNDDDKGFDFLTGLQRLRQAANKGIQSLGDAVEREKRFVIQLPCESSLHSQFNGHEQGITANTLFPRYHYTEKVALKSTPDGDCFFNSISTLLSGDESRSIEMRYRCVLELVSNKSAIQLHPQYKKLHLISCDIDEECISCTKQGNSSSMTRFIAMSRVLNLQIDVIYPAVSGSKNYYFQVLNTTLRLPFADTHKGRLTLMWSSLRLPEVPAKWEANHIGPLVSNVQRGHIIDIPEASLTFQQTPKTPKTQKITFAAKNKYHVLSDEDEYVESDPTPSAASKEVTKNKRKRTLFTTQGNTDASTKMHCSKKGKAHVSELEPSPCARLEIHDQCDNSVDSDLSYVSEQDPVPCTLTSPSELNEHGPMAEPPTYQEVEDGTVLLNDMTNKSYSSNTESNTFQPGPLKKFLELDKVIEIFKGPYVVLNEIPIGRKDGMYYIVNNEENNERRSNGLSSEHWDDCGAWKNATSPYTYFLDRTGKRDLIIKRGGEYCTANKIQGKRQFIPLEPQPSNSDIISVHRLYQTLKFSQSTNTQFRRRITWFEKAEHLMSEINNGIAVVEYIGIFPERHVHGGVKK